MNSFVTLVSAGLVPAGPQLTSYQKLLWQVQAALHPAWPGGSNDFPLPILSQTRLTASPLTLPERQPAVTRWVQ